MTDLSTSVRIFSPALYERLVESIKSAQLLAALGGCCLAGAVFDGQPLCFAAAVINGFALAAEVRNYARLVDLAAQIAITRTLLARGAGQVAANGCRA